MCTINVRYKRIMHKENNMLAQWSNTPKLDSLTASHLPGNPSVLIFKTNIERARVVLDGGDIKEVVFTESGNQKPILVKAEEAHRIVVGEGNAERDVYHFLKPGGPAPTMRLGITKHRGFGTWSSLPHDFELNPEVGFEEVFFHILTGGVRGREPVAWQRGKGVWHDGKPVDEMWPVKSHTFSTIPMGYHPVVGEPGVHVSYVWVYLAKHAHWEKVK